MRNYKVGLDAEAEYRTAMGGTSGTVKTTLSNRQIDILLADELYAGQLKTGKVFLTSENILAIQKDAELVKLGWSVEHILEKGASKPYLDALKRAGIKVHIGPKI
jgi:ABC-type phosphate transport system ATPase subunit